MVNVDPGTNEIGLNNLLIYNQIRLRIYLTLERIISQIILSNINIRITNLFSWRY